MASRPTPRSRRRRSAARTERCRRARARDGASSSRRMVAGPLAREYWGVPETPGRRERISAAERGLECAPPNSVEERAMRGARIREKLTAGGAVLNVMVPFHSPAVIEMLGLAGVDLVMLDAEHGAIDEAQCEHMVRAADVVDLPAIVRVPNNQPSTILRYLDLGSSGIIAPHIASAANARAAVAAAKYVPAGQRSYGSPRAQVVSRAGA